MPELTGETAQFEQEAEGEAEPAEIPDWLQALEPQGSEAEAIGPEQLEVKSQEPEVQVPEVQAAEMTGETAQFEQEEESVAEPAEIPDWLQALEPRGRDELREEPVEEKEPDWFSEGPPILGDTQPVKVQSSAQPIVEEPAPEMEIPAETEGLAQEASPAEVETRPEEKEIAAEAWSEEELSPLQAAQEAEPIEAQELAPETAYEAGAMPIIPEEAAEEPVTAADEWQPEEAKAVPSEEVASMLSEMQDSEDAFAWLEGLAVRQGADEALILNPEERSDTPPEWVQAEIEEAEEEEISPEKAAEMEAEAVPDEEQPSEWSLEPESEVGEEEIPTWIESEQAMAASKTSEIDQPAAYESLEAEGEASVDEEISTEEAIVMETEALAEEELTEEGEAREEIPELPDWLQESAAEGGEEAAWTPPTIERPLEKLDLNQASLAELERLPDIGFRMAQNIVNYRDTFGAFKAVDELLDIPGLGPEILADIQDWLFVTRQAEEVPEEAVSALTGPEITEGPAELMEARQQIASGDFEQAAQSYTQIIKSNQHLEAIIQDLQTATQQYPHAIYLWQTLGDAHLRVGQIQMALDAYNQAEKLLS
jgi:competence ComEA-like helix-hairpin-helix protein